MGGEPLDIVEFAGRRAIECLAKCYACSPVGDEPADAALRHLRAEYGERFVERVVGVRVIAAAVLVAFSARLERRVVFDRAERAWRLRSDEEPPAHERLSVSGCVGKSPRLPPHSGD